MVKFFEYQVGRIFAVVIIGLLFLFSDAEAQTALSVISPNGGEEWPLFSTQTIKWAGGNSTDLVNIVLEPGFGTGEPPFDITLTPIANTGVYSWMVYPIGQTPEKYYLRVTAMPSSYNPWTALGTPLLRQTISSSLSSPTSIFISGGYVYITSAANNSLFIFSQASDGSFSQVGSTTAGLSSPRDIKVIGNYAYIVNTLSSALSIFDVSESSSPTLVSSITTGLNTPKEVAVRGQYAYVASDGNASLVIFNVSNPANPQLVSVTRVSLGEGADSLDVEGNYAYVASYIETGLTGPFYIFDISNPTSPRQMSRTTTLDTEGAMKIRVRDNIAYIGSEADPPIKLYLYDVRDPREPRILSKPVISSGAGGSTTLYVSGNYAILGREGIALNDLTICNIANPTKPVCVVSLFDLGNVESVFVSGNYLYIVDGGNNRVLIYSISGLDAPRVAATTDDSDSAFGIILQTGSAITSFAANPSTVASGGAVNFTFSAAGASLYKFSLKCPDGISAPSSGGEHCNTRQIFSSGTASYSATFLNSTASNQTITATLDAYRTGGTVLMGTKSITVTILSASSPPPAVTLTEVGALNVGSGAVSAIYVRNPYAYLGLGANAGGSEFMVVDISNPANPRIVGGLETSKAVNAVAVFGNYAYLGTSVGPENFIVVDISNPSNPLKVAALTFPVAINAVTISGRYAYVGLNQTTNEFRIIDVSDPRAPSEVGALDFNLVVTAISIIDRYAYLGMAGGIDEFRIIDVSNPSSPVQVGRFDFPHIIYTMAVSGRYAYLGMDVGSNEFRIVDIFEPTRPSQVGVLDFPATVFRLALSGSYAFLSVTPAPSDMYVVDVSTPSSPRSVLELKLGGPVLAIVASGSYVFTAGISGTTNYFKIFSLSSPAFPSAPTVTLSILPVSITQGQSAVLSWISTNASSCSSSSNPSGWIGTKATSGSETVTPAQTTTYTISCSGSGGSVSQSVTVAVTSANLTNITFSPKLQGRTDLSGVSFTIQIFTAGQTTELAKFTVTGGTGSLPSTVTLAPASYDIRADSPYYLSQKTTLSLSSNQTFTLPTLPAGDLNDDNIINSMDWSLMSPKWFTSDPVADLNKDGSVNSIDFSLLNRNWGKSGG